MVVLARDVTGHFTLWDGAAKNLLYVGPEQREKDSSSPLFYFWMVSPYFHVKRQKMCLIETTSVSFWELK
ncbi:hypothetical protein ACFW0P_06905 [Lysobacter soli]|uniref:hypothetical protein n=1 Tax=Lysobacter soli TaxID=453783 RepID=UPI0036B9D73C